MPGLTWDAADWRSTSVAACPSIARVTRCHCNRGDELSPDHPLRRMANERAGIAAIQVPAPFCPETCCIHSETWLGVLVVSRWRDSTRRSTASLMAGPFQPRRMPSVSVLAHSKGADACIGTLPASIVISRLVMEAFSCFRCNCRSERMCRSAENGTINAGIITVGNVASWRLG